MFFVATQTRQDIDTQSCIRENGRGCSLLLTTISIKATVELNTCVCVCGGESEYLRLKVFAWVWVCVFARWKNSIHLFALCANYSYLSNSRYTQASVCVCVFLSICVCLYIKGQLGFSIFQTACAIQRTRPSPTWLPLMFHINHWVVYVCVCVWEGEGCFCTRSKQRFKSLTPLIKASHYNTNKQSKCIHTSIC